MRITWTTYHCSEPASGRVVVTGDSLDACAARAREALATRLPGHALGRVVAVELDVVDFGDAA